MGKLIEVQVEEVSEGLSGGELGVGGFSAAAVCQVEAFNEGFGGQAWDDVELQV